MKIKMIRLLVIILPFFIISCSDMESDSKMSKKLDEISDAQNLVLKKISGLEKSITNLKLSNNKPADNKKPPQADPNKVYNVPIGDSFSKGPKDAAVTIIEWSDFQ